MCRSVLPCKNRKAARQGKAAVVRRERRGARQALRDLTYAEEEAYDEGQDQLVALERQGRVQRTREVWHRRSGDKINHFVRWARARTRRCASDREARESLRPQLPLGGLVVEHALGHFVDPERDYNPHWFGGPWRRLEPARPWRSQEELSAALKEAWELAHAALNRALRRVRVAPIPEEGLGAWSRWRVPPRLGPVVVAGRADVERVASQVWAWGSAEFSLVVEPPPSAGAPARSGPKTADAHLARFLEGLQGRQR